MISYDGIDEASLLFGLFHAAKVEGAYAKIDRPNFTLAEAQKTLPSWPLREEESKEPVYLPRICGRMIGVTLYPGKKELRVEQFDDVNGKGACNAVVEALLGAKKTSK